MATCERCGEHVSDQFVREDADESGTVRTCPNCSANAGIAKVMRERVRTA